MMFDVGTTAEVMRMRRRQRGMTQRQLADAVGVGQRQVARYEDQGPDGQAPTLPVATRIAAALGISIAELAGVIPSGLDLSGDWWAAWQTWLDGEERVDVHPLTISQDGEFLNLDGARADAETSYSWVGELRLWDSEALMGWYRADDGATRSKGTIYFALHPHGEYAAGTWSGLSHQGIVVRGWGAMARTEEQVRDLIASLIRTEGALESWPPKHPTS